MAEIYDMSGNEITVGLQGAACATRPSSLRGTLLATGTRMSTSLTTGSGSFTPTEAAQRRGGLVNDSR